MNLRLMGNTDLVLIFSSILERMGLPGQIYPQRRGGGSRLYIELDDRKAAELADRMTDAQIRGQLLDGKR